MRYVAPPPPPYVPDEYRNRTIDEIPEPYKTEILRWIERQSAYYKARVDSARGVLVGAIVLAALAFTCVGVFILTNLIK